MKCIKMKKDGKILRLPDFQAATYVEKNLASYIPKSEWKKEDAKKNDYINNPVNLNHPSQSERGIRK